MTRAPAMLGVVFACLLGSRTATVEDTPSASRTFRFTYSVVVRDIPWGAHRISIWIPVPRSDAHQEVRELRVKTPFPYEITEEKSYGNRLLHLGAKTPLP